MTILHFVSRAETDNLQERFAKLTQHGWETPAWVELLQATCVGARESALFTHIRMREARQQCEPWVRDIIDGDFSAGGDRPMPKVSRR